MVEGFRSTPTCWFNVSMYQFQNMWMVKWTHKINTSITEIQFPKKKGHKVYEKCCMWQKKKRPSMLCRKRNKRSSGSNAPSTYRKWHGMKNLKCLTYWSYVPYTVHTPNICIYHLLLEGTWYVASSIQKWSMWKVYRSSLNTRRWGCNSWSFSVCCTFRIRKS